MARQRLGDLGRLIFLYASRSHFRLTTLDGTPLNERPARRRDLCLTTYNTHKWQTSMSLAGFEPTIPVSERPQTHALNRAATGIGRFAPTIPTSERPQTHALDRAATGIGYSNPRSSSPWATHCTDYAVLAWNNVRWISNLNRNFGSFC